MDGEPYKCKEQDEEGDLLHGRHNADDTAPESLEDPDWSLSPETG